MQKHAMENMGFGFEKEKDSMQLSRILSEMTKPRSIRIRKNIK